MVDGIKIFQGYLEKDHSDFLLNKFHFGGYFDLTDGDEIPICSRKNKGKDYNSMIWRKAVHQDMEIYLGWKHNKLTKTTHWNLIAQGSLHKYACNGNNKGRFTAHQAELAFNNLCQDLRIDKAKSKFTNIEFFAICYVPTLKYSTFDYINLYLLRLRTHPFEWMTTNIKNKKIGKSSDFTHKKYKLYSTGKNSLKYEIHWCDLQELREKFNLSPANFTSDLIIDITSKYLPTSFSEVVSLNGISLEEKSMPKAIKKKNRDIFKNYSNNLYLEHIDKLIEKAIGIGDTKEKMRLEKNDQRHRKRFHELANFHGDRSNELIYQKILEWIEYSKQKCLFFESGIKSKKKTKKGSVYTTNN